MRKHYNTKRPRILEWIEGRSEEESDVPTRAITADAASEIELAANDLRDLEGLLIVMQQAYVGGEPDPEVTVQALNSVSTSLMKIRESLDAVLDNIYGKGKE